MGFAIPAQYLNSLGWWPSYFNNSKTLFWNSNDFRLRLHKFCHLMNMAHPPKQEKITLDFVLLLVLSRQWWAFRRERRSENSPAGSNESVVHLADHPNIVNPVPDFTTYAKNTFDTCSQILFSSWFYWSLMSAFFAGIMRTSLYSFGFILCASVFLWEGSDIYLRPPNKILLRWNCFLAYNILVMIARATSQVFGCVSTVKFLTIRAGDYRYFDQVDKDIDIPLVPPRDIDEEEYDSYDPMPFGEEQTNYKAGVRVGSNKIWYPTGSYKEILNEHASSQQNQQVLSVASLPVSMGDYFPRSLLHGFSALHSAASLSISYHTHPLSTQIPVDEYLPMFLCDLVNLCLLLFFFGSFKSNSDQMGLLEYVQFNQVPISFIIAVLIYMGFMMIDRAIYLRRNRFAKLIYHFIDSYLELADWFKMEDVTQSLFDRKCQQESEAKCNRPSGQPYNRTTKLLVGELLFMLLIMTLIFPFFLFSLSSTVGIATLPHTLKLAIYMGRSQQIFEAYVTRSDLIQLSDEDYLNISATFDNIEAADTIFDAFKVEDIVVVKWSPHSMTTWDISPGSKEELLEDLENEDPFTFRLEIQYTHVGHGGQQSNRVFAQTSDLAPLPNAERQNLIDIVKAKTDTSTLRLLPLIFPKFLKIDKEGRPEVLSMMEHLEDPNKLRNLLLTLRRSKAAWWQLSEECTILDDNYVYYLTNLAHNDWDFLVLYLFNERVFSNAMNFMTQGGIMGLYLIYFLVVVNIIRGFRGDIEEISINDLPNSSKVLRKCMEIYFARDMKNYHLEQEIFEEIVYIMRSRELMIKLS
ncbi:hypothetical protein HUJ05_001375, partial [Dendroctonus ponderosae]